MKRFSIAAVTLGALLLFPIMSQAQNDGETFEQYRQRMRKDYAGYKKQAEDDFAAYRKKVNDEYAEFLRTRWKEMDMLRGVPAPRDTVPPTVMPEEERNRKRQNDPKPIEEVVKPAPPKPQPEPVAPVVEPAPQPRMDTIQTLFCHTPLQYIVPQRPQLTLRGTSNDDIADAWKTLSDGRCEALLAQCLKVRKEYCLNDYAYLQVLSGLGSKLFADNNAAVLITAWLYCQSGYKIRLAVDDNKNRLHIFYGSTSLVYNTPYLISDDIYFGFMTSCIQGIRFCDATFPGERSLSLAIPQQPRLDMRRSNSRILVSKRYADMKLTVNTNRNMIDFYNVYPTGSLDEDFGTRWANYANTDVSDAVKQSLYPQLRGKLEGKSRLQAVEELLNWVQTSLVYEYDSVAWGVSDRAFFPEETLFYPYADCEDRAILFTRLVRDILGLRAVLIFYPGHLGAAVRVEDSNATGDYVTLDDGRYYIADPTYIGAPVGATMPCYKNTTVKVIRIDNPK